ncbi:MAG: molybdopterin-synthase adenylyltransferase MoeB [Gammaproteobacteria bacterium]|jgi:adenylyltransferase/sulfurtransferase|nr:MAG: molybdopterin-synthase adenylyltransferase MoeB [Gammaproteobacteria bacterium]
MDLTDDQLLRYSRQIMLPEVDVAGQEKLLGATVLIVGLGGLGSPAALYLASAGIGRLMLCDHDEVDLSNLQRQIVHHQENIGQLKVDSAAATLAGINPDVALERIPGKLHGDALNDAVARANVVVDATDNFEVRFELNRACVAAGVPLVSAAAIRWEGQVAIFDPRDPESPCYRCLYAEGDDGALNCSENGVIAPLVGVIGTCQAMETIKLITGVGETLTGFVLYFDGKRMEWRRLRLPKDPNCPVCGN